MVKVIYVEKFITLLSGMADRLLIILSCKVVLYLLFIRNDC